MLTQILNKLHIPEVVDDDKIRTLKLLIHSVQTVRFSSFLLGRLIWYTCSTQRRPLRDAVSKNALRRFDNAISKKFEMQLEGFSEEEYRKLAELKELFDFLDDVIPDDDDVDTDVPRRKGKKRYALYMQIKSTIPNTAFLFRRSESIATTSTESLRQGSPVSLTRDGKPQAKYVKKFSASRRAANSC